DMEKRPGAPETMLESQYSNGVRRIRTSGKGGDGGDDGGIGAPAGRRRAAGRAYRGREEPSRAPTGEPLRARRYGSAGPAARPAWYSRSSIQRRSAHTARPTATPPKATAQTSAPPFIIASSETMPGATASRDTAACVLLSSTCVLMADSLLVGADGQPQHQ